MTEPVKIYALWLYDDDGRLSPHMAELHTLPTPKERTGYILAADHDRVVQELCAENERLEEELGETESRALRFIHQCNAHVELYQELRTERDQLRAEVERLRALLAEAAQDIADWGAYASDYFQEKHGLDACIEKYQAALAGGEEG